MTQVTVHQAKTHLSRLIQQALSGEEVVIAKRDRPLVRLEVVKEQKRPRTIGWAKGLVTHIAADFDAPLPEMAKYMFTRMEMAKRPARAKRK